MSYKRKIGEAGPTRSETSQYSMTFKASPAFPNPTVVLVFVHIYSGWLPGSLLPKGAQKVVHDFECDPASLDFATWHNMLSLAQMLELKALTLGINRHLVTLLEDQFKELAAVEPTCGVC
ncbi:hypothetical protein GGF32_007603 [Allomyces javanicus]|nr:hypothetical protein GGF32_007603 [Allomyces javanicus]